MELNPFAYLLLLLTFQAPNPVWGAMQERLTTLPNHDLNYGKLREIGEWKKGKRVNDHEYAFGNPNDPDMDKILRCKRPGSKIFKKRDDYVGCCDPKDTLYASDHPAKVESWWECCKPGHALAGSRKVGFYCCPTGETYDGHKCCLKVDPLVCHNGKKLVNGKCVCPSGKKDDGKGHCVDIVHDTCKCGSGIVAGRCYTIQGEGGLYYGPKMGRDGNNKPILHGYASGKEYAEHTFGLFKFCVDSKCQAAGIDPGRGFHIKDLKGLPPDGKQPGQWLGKESDGTHIGRTSDYSQSGVFTITKWPCGKYCLGGFGKGLGPTCPSDYSSVTFTKDPLGCVIVTVTEVPCNPHDHKNNCIWKNGEQCCNRIDCSGKPCAPAAHHNTPVHETHHNTPFHSAHAHLQYMAHEPDHHDHHEHDDFNHHEDEYHDHFDHDQEWVLSDD